MKYSSEVDIDKPIDEVLKVFEDPDAVKHWQKGFVGMDHLEGEKAEQDQKPDSDTKWGLAKWK